MYVRDLNGGKPIVFKTVVSYCPPDCGGADEDEIDYEAFCPVCDRRFDDLDHDKFCRECGTKLYWPAKWPIIKKINN